MYIHIYLIITKRKGGGVKSTVRHLPRFEIAKSDFFSIQNFLKLKKKINNRYFSDYKCLSETRVASSNSAIALLISFSSRKNTFCGDIFLSYYNDS